MRNRPIAGTVFVAALVLVAVGCRSDCADIGYVVKPPADTTVALGQSIVLTAATGGRCVGGPIRYGSVGYWKAVDSTIVSVAVLDSIHTRVTGRAAGTTAVITSSSLDFVYAWSTTQVTVR
jgi:hypothetical protein